MNNPTTIDEILNNTGCTCYHETGCEIISNTEHAKTAIETLLAQARIDELDNLGFSYGVISYQAISNRIAELNKQLEGDTNVATSSN